MKLKFNRNVRHNGMRFEQGKTYDVKDQATADHLLSLTHTDVYVRLREGDLEDSVEVKLCEVAAEGAQAEAQPAEKPAAPKPATPPAQEGSA